MAACENPVASIVVPYKLWEINKNITIWHYTIDPLDSRNEQADLELLDPKDRDIIVKSAQEAMAWEIKEVRKGLRGSTEAIEGLKKNRMDVVVLTTKDAELFKAKTKSVYDKWVKEIELTWSVMRKEL